jgi:hypothetical protein
LQKSREIKAQEHEVADDLEGPRIVEFEEAVDVNDYEDDVSRCTAKESKGHSPYL